MEKMRLDRAVLIIAAFLILILLIVSFVRGCEGVCGIMGDDPIGVDYNAVDSLYAIGELE